jgi:hypothetical protein
LYVKNSWLRLKRLLEFGHHFIYLIVRVGAVTCGIHRFSAQVASDSFLVEKGTLRCTGSFEFAIFKKNQPYGHQNKEKC